MCATRFSKESVVTRNDGEGCMMLELNKGVKRTK